MQSLKLKFELWFDSTSQVVYFTMQISILGHFIPKNKIMHIELTLNRYNNIKLHKIHLIIKFQCLFVCLFVTGDLFTKTLLNSGKRTFLFRLKLNDVENKIIIKETSITEG